LTETRLSPNQTQQNRVVKHFRARKLIRPSTAKKDLGQFVESYPYANQALDTVDIQAIHIQAGHDTTLKLNNFNS
jgi:hypothetical protein